MASQGVPSDYNEAESVLWVIILVILLAKIVSVIFAQSLRLFMWMKMKLRKILINISYGEDSSSLLAVEDLLSYSFKDINLLQDALIHSSYYGSPLDSYESLEFVGDAVLDLAFAEYLFRTYPRHDQGQLSLLRAANTRNENLARVAVRHHLYRYVRRKNTSSLDNDVSEFSYAVQKEDDAFTHYGTVEAPKILADIVESIGLAAVYFDCNCDLKILWKVFKTLMKPIVTPETLLKQPQPVSMLNEFYQKQHKELVYEWKDNIAKFSVDGELIGSYFSTQQFAKFNAAKEALQKLSKLKPL